MDESDPYRPPAEPPSSFALDNDKHVANGCAIAGMVLFGFGALSVCFVAIVMLQAFIAPDSETPVSPETIRAMGYVAVLGFCWAISGILAYKMAHAWSILFFVAGVLLFVVIARAA